jgi:hypothetical protein
MPDAHEYRQVANDCIVWARIATSDDQRARLVELAKTVGGRREGAGTRQSHPEMAGSGNRSGWVDPLATDEERQLRKRRLIEGPQEFRDIRSNRAKISISN